MADDRKPWESVAGIWKLACAVAILLGHHLVTLSEWHPDDPVAHAAFRILQVFSPFQFFFFSGYLASSMLADVRRPLRGAMVGRFLRVYVLLAGGLLWAAAVRVVFVRCGGPETTSGLWPLGSWDRPFDALQLLRHFDPLGFVDSTRINYAAWYLYQELRLVLLMPLFRWVLRRPSLRQRWAACFAILAASAVLESRFWSWFPLFRTSPFQTLAFGAVFLAGALIWTETRPGGRLARLSPRVAFAAIAVGCAFSSLSVLDVRLPLQNPSVLLLPILAAQIALFVGLRALVADRVVPLWLRKACDGSVGIYVVHPPVHLVAVWIAVRMGSLWPFPASIATSLLLGWAFHRFVETPSQGWVRAIQGKRG